MARVVEVNAVVVTSVALVLTAIPIEELYHVTLRGDGLFGCGFAARGPAPIGNNALAACGVTYGTPVGSVDKFRVDFKLTAENATKIKNLVLETQWRSTQALSGGFDMYWENFQDWGAGTTYTEGSPRRVARVFGNSPLKAVTDEGVLRSMAKQSPPLKYCKVDGPCWIYARAFPYAGTLGPSSQADVSVYLDQRFTHYATEFYGDFSPPDFTVLLALLRRFISAG